MFFSIRDYQILSLQVEPEIRLIHPRGAVLEVDFPSNHYPIPVWPPLLTPTPNRSSHLLSSKTGAV